MTVKFAYDLVGGSYFGKVFRPVAKVSFQSPVHKLWVDTWMIVDTGADFSILPHFLTKDLSISLEKDCIKEPMAGVGGDQNVFLCKKRIKAKIGNLQREIPLAFFDNDEVPALLGRLGFLETFDVEFLKSHQVIFNS